MVYTLKRIKILWCPEVEWNKFIDLSSICALPVVKSFKFAGFVCHAEF